MASEPVHGTPPSGYSIQSASSSRYPTSRALEYSQLTTPAATTVNGGSPSSSPLSAPPSQRLLVDQTLKSDLPVAAQVRDTVVRCLRGVA